MPRKSTYYKQKMKRENPKGYANYLEKQRLDNKRRRDEEKKRWEEGFHTRAQVQEHEAKLQAKRERERARYYKKKGENMRQTRNSLEAMGPKPRIPGEKRPKDMTPDEKRTYHAMMRRKQREARSSQKKTADNIKRQRQEKKEEAIRQKLAKEERKERKRLPKKAYNLNNEYKSKSRAIDLSHEEYAQNALNLLNPRIPEKRLAIAAQQERHPCRALFVTKVDYNVEEELGIEILDDPELPLEIQEECSNKNHELIRDFYKQEEVSHILPHARYSTKHGAARVMVKTIKATYELFKEAHPTVQVSLTLFQQQRPRNVRLLGSVPIESCLCMYCTNVRLKIKALNQLLGNSVRLPSEGKLLNFINCPVETKWNNVKCIDGECDSCKDRLRPVHIFCWDIVPTTDVSWKRWCRQDSGKMEPVSKSGTVKDLLEEFKTDLVEPSRGVSFAQHLFVAYWQYDQYRANRRNPSDGEIVIVQDFAENRKAIYAEEIKSAHFGKNQVTVHPMVCFYRSGTDDIIRHSIMALSDDIGHDHHAVNCFTLAALDVLKKEGSFQKVTLWSDGAAGQYKGKGSFADLSLITGMNVQRCFYGSEHGKGEADGETGVLSQILRRASSQGHTFANAKEMVSYLSKAHAINTPLKKRQYFLLNDIDRDRPESEVQTIPGTRSYHQFRKVGPYILQARRLACFCSACNQENLEGCINQHIVGKYQTHKLKPSIKTTLNEVFIADEEDTVQPNTSKDDTDAPKVKIGDYLKISCEINKLKKTFYAVVIPSPVASSDFYVRFFKRATGQAYVFGDSPDEGLIYTGAPDFYSWEIIPAQKVQIDNRGHYYF